MISDHLDKNLKRLVAVFLVLGAIGSFGLATKDSFKSIYTTRSGAPVGEEFTVRVTTLDRIGYVTLGVLFAMGALYIVARRKE